MPEVLLYPQTVLLLAPVLLRLIWAATRPVLRHVDPRVRASVLVTMIVLPVAAVAVPYVPALAPHLPVPWRAPIAWGMSNYPSPADEVAYLMATVMMCALLLVPPVAVTILLVRGSWQSYLLTRRIGGQRHPAGFTLVPGRAVACTVGLWRPRVLLSADVWDSDHGAVVLRHEQTHAWGRHPLLLALARASLVLWWWIPGTRGFFDDLRGALEECADARARAVYGRVEVARAIVDIGVAPMPMTSLGFGDSNGIERRIATLAHGSKRVPTLVAVVVAAVAVPLWLLLL